MMENFPNYLSTSSSNSTSSFPFHQMLINSRASELVVIHEAGHFQQPPVPNGVPMFHSVLSSNMSVGATSSMKDDAANSVSKTLHVDHGLAKVVGMDGLGKNKAFEAGETTTATKAGSGGYDKKKKSRSRRFAFQTRSQVDILDDGYRWRKYGQKAVKNNKFPRSYYRCTNQGCKVKKQVQRLTRDEGMVVTTYEGIHSHPIQKSTDNFEHILTQMQIYTSH